MRQSKIRNVARWLLAVSFIVINGCTYQAASNTDSHNENNSHSDNSQAADVVLDDSATYQFHRNKSFTDVSETLPDGSVDHIDFDTTHNPNVIVVVTIKTPYKEGMAFTTTFVGPNTLSITKEWKPGAGGDPNNHVGLFILPDAIQSGSTVITCTNNR